MAVAVAGGSGCVDSVIVASGSGSGCVDSGKVAVVV
jgi:hypothetical protein